MPTRKIFCLITITIVIAIFTLISILAATFNICFIRTPVKGASMYPTLNQHVEQTGKQDIVYINRFADVHKGDIVVLDLNNHPSFGNYSIKRLIATEGDLVKILLDLSSMTFNLYVNDTVIYSKPYEDGFNTHNSLNQYIENHQHDTTRIIKDQNDNNCVVIKENEIFVLGDNWSISKDSSLVGPFSKKTIVGKVDIVVKPNQNEFVQILKRIF